MYILLHISTSFFFVFFLGFLKFLKNDMYWMWSVVNSRGSIYDWMRWYCTMKRMKAWLNKFFILGLCVSTLSYVSKCLRCERTSHQVSQIGSAINFYRLLFGLHQPKWNSYSHKQSDKRLNLSPFLTPVVVAFIDSYQGSVNYSLPALLLLVIHIFWQLSHVR